MWRYRLLAHAGGSAALIEHGDSGLVYRYNLQGAALPGQQVSYQLADNMWHFLPPGVNAWSHHDLRFPNFQSLVTWWTYERTPAGAWAEIADSRNRLADARASQIRRG